MRTAEAPIASADEQAPVQSTEPPCTTEAIVILGYD